MITQENKHVNLISNENTNGEIDFFGVIRFLIINRVFILSGLFLAAFCGLTYIAYERYRPQKTVTTTIIPIKATGIAQNEFHNALNLSYINPLFKAIDRDKIEKNEIVYDAFYYLNKKLNPSSATTRSSDTKPVLINSLKFAAFSSEYGLIVESPQKNIPADELVEAVNFASNKYNRALLIASGESADLVDLNDYISHKNKLMLSLITTQIRIKELILPLQYQFEAIESNKFSPLFKRNRIDDIFVFVRQMLDQKTDFTNKENFKNLIAELEINKKITPSQAVQTIKQFLDLDRLLTNQSAKLSNFPLDKILPLFERAGPAATETTPLETKNQSSIFLVCVAALIFGSLAGICATAGKSVYMRFKSEFRDNGN